LWVVSTLKLGAKFSEVNMNHRLLTQDL
jgi:hypothetical protein